MIEFILFVIVYIIICGLFMRILEWFDNTEYK